MPPFLIDQHPGEVWFPEGENINVSLESNAFGCQNDANIAFELPALPAANFEVISEPCSGLGGRVSKTCRRIAGHFPGISGEARDFRIPKRAQRSPIRLMAPTA